MSAPRCLAFVSDRNESNASSVIVTLFSVKARLRRQQPLTNDLKSCVGAALLEQRNLVDRKLAQGGGGEALLQHCDNGAAPGGIEPAGQCHVEAEFLEHVRIYPTVEIVALPRCQR